MAKKAKKLHTKKGVELKIVNPNAAGIDIADTEMQVCVPIDRDGDNNRRFGSFTRDLNGSLVQPLFNRGANIANLKIAKAEQEVAVLNFQQSLLNVGAEVNDALTALQTARRKLDIDNTQVATLQEAVRKTELLMRHSSANYLEVLTAQQTLLTAKQAVAQDRFDEIQSIITLYHALGGGK